jgi:hypothetical protein
MSITSHVLVPIQFKPVPVVAEDPEAACKIPARVSCSGMVSSVDMEHHSFMLFLTQNISASPHRETLPVRAVLEKGPKWPNPIARLPSPLSFVAFTGKLAHFKDNAAKGESKLLSQAVVTLDSIIYLHANYSSTSVPMPLPSSQPHDADMIALKTRLLRFSQIKTKAASPKNEVADHNQQTQGIVVSQHCHRRVVLFGFLS